MGGKKKKGKGKKKGGSKKKGGGDGEKVGHPHRVRARSRCARLGNSRWGAGAALYECSADVGTGSSSLCES